MLLTSMQVSSLLKCSPYHVRKYAEQGLLKSTRTVGGHLRFFLADVEEFNRKTMGGQK